MIKDYIKFELRSTWKLNVLFVGISAIIALLSSLPVTLLSITHSPNNDATISRVASINVLLYTIRMLLLCAVIIYFLIRYHKTTHGEEHFFTYKLPMTRQQLFIAKWLSLSIWLILSFATAFIDFGFICFDNIWSYFHGTDYVEFTTMLLIFLAILLVAVLLSLYIAFHCISIFNISPLLGMGTVPGAIITCVIVSIARKFLYLVFSIISLFLLVFLISLTKNGANLLLVILIFMTAGIIGIFVTELIIIIAFTQFNKRAFKKDAF